MPHNIQAIDNSFITVNKSRKSEDSISLALDTNIQNILLKAISTLIL